MQLGITDHEYNKILEQIKLGEYVKNVTITGRNNGHSTNYIQPLTFNPDNNLYEGLNDKKEYISYTIKEIYDIFYQKYSTEHYNYTVIFE